MGAVAAVVTSHSRAALKCLELLPVPLRRRIESRLLAAARSRRSEADRTFALGRRERMPQAPVLRRVHALAAPFGVHRETSKTRHVRQDTWWSAV